MLFNSYTFILIFLPLVAVFNFLIHRHLPAKWAYVFLLLASLGFMSFWNVYFALVLIFSVLFNFTCGLALSAATERAAKNKKTIFIAAIVANILYLGFFKYSNFFLANVNTFFAGQIDLFHILLPIGISFYTFMQIAWLTDMPFGTIPLRLSELLPLCHFLSLRHFGSDRISH